MRTLLVLMLLSPLSCLAQELPPNPQPSPPGPNQQVPAAQPEAPAPSTAITVPANTRVQLALANPIHARAAHVGDIVRAVTTFPVTVGQDLAIPQGAYMEGRIVRVGKHGSTLFDGLQIEFKQLVLSNGYVAALDGSVAEAKALAPVTDVNRGAGTPGVMANSLQQGPTPPPLPQLGPSKALVIGIGTAAMVGIVAMVNILGRRHARDQGRDFDTGFQFEMVLQEPLTLDGARVAAAASGATGN